jgi:lysophospholipase L1-like esterase
VTEIGASLGHRASPAGRTSLALQLASLLPGVREVRAQIPVYADAWEESNRLALAERGPLWVVAGDSTAQGIGASSYTRGWVGQLRDQLTRHGVRLRLLNLSHSGARVRDVLREQLPVVGEMGVAPALLTVAAGANDLRWSRRRELAGDLELLLDQLLRGAVVATIPGRPHVVDMFNELIRRRATEYGLRVADINRALTRPWRPRFAADHFHPSDLGYADWARAFSIALS